MKSLFFITSILLALFLVAPYEVYSQKVSLANTSWIISTCICDGKYNDWADEGTITFLSNGRIKDSQGRWRLAGNALKVTNFDEYQPEITAKVAGNKMTGTTSIGMTPRLFKLRAVKVMPQAPEVPEGSEFFGTWEYDAYGSKHYLRISDAGMGRFKLQEGFLDLAREIEWMEPDIKNANGIYLRVVNGKLTANFASESFRPTHSYPFTYTITCEIKADRTMTYTVLMSVGKTKRGTERNVATKISN